MAVPIAVGRALQALQVTPRAGAAPWTGLGASQSTENILLPRKMESWELVEGFHSTHAGTGKLIIVAHAGEQHKTQS